MLSNSYRIPPGTRLNGIYEVEAVLAEGGMGEVYRAHNIQTGDPVAIKLMLPELSANPDALALFRREASTLHSLSHEAIVRYFVFSVDPDLQRAYLAMEFVDGPSLATRLKQGPLDLDSVRVLQRRLADGLDMAHRYGVVHRDISPDNVILPGGDVRRAKIIDFGIAKLQHKGDSTIIGGGFAGKYNYVSPEQLGLAGGTVTPKSDIYSFGLVLAEALRGRAIDMGGSQFEVVEKRRHVPDLSDLPSAIRPLIESMLQPLPDDRPASMAEVAQWGQEREPTVSPIRDKRTGRPRPTRRPSQGGKGRLVGAIAGGIALLAVSSGFALVYLQPDLLEAILGPIGAEGTPPDERPALPPPSLPAPKETPAAAKPPLLLPPSDDSGGPAAPTTPAIDAGQTPSLTPSPDKASPHATLPNPDRTGEEPGGKHVPTADEILASIEAMKRKQPAAPSFQGPDTGASNEKPSVSGAPARPPTPTPPPPSPTPSKQSEPAQTPAPKPQASNQKPVAPSATLTLDDAVIEKSYVAQLPPFADANDPKGLKLSAGPGLPEGLSFADRGSGFGILSGNPHKAGRYSFPVTATDPQGQSASMTLAINIVAPTLPQTPPVAGPVKLPPDTTPSSLSRKDRMVDLVRRFDGGPCFFVRSLSVSDSSASIEGFGSQIAPFQKLETDLQSVSGFDPKINVRKITDAQCAAASLGAAALPRDESDPQIVLSGYAVGRAKPLTGAVNGIGDRHLELLLVSDDGTVAKLTDKATAAGGIAPFSVPLVADKNSVDAPQLLIAVVSRSPLPSLSALRGTAQAAQLMPRVRDELKAADGGGLDVQFFKLSD
jgi:serine/threonine protein kinase